jgi:serine/threonine protein kinase
MTDFGSATDFSELPSSLTDNGDRGTPRYFSPEVAKFDPSRSASDIFAMGCVFLEVITLCMGYSLEITQTLRARKDQSFQANLDRIIHWFDTEENLCRRAADEHLVGLIRHMMRPNPRDRPRASHVEEQIALISGLAKASGGSEFSRPCCGLGMFLPVPDRPSQIPDSTKIVQITRGNSCRDSLEIGWHHITYFIDIMCPELVEKVHLYVVSAAQITLVFPPLKYKSSIKASTKHTSF